MMKKHLYNITDMRLITIICALLIGIATATAQDKDSMYIHLRQSQVVRMPINSIDSIDFVSPGESTDAVFVKAEELSKLYSELSQLRSLLGNATMTTYGYDKFTAGTCWITKNEGAVGTAVETNNSSSYSYMRIAVTKGMIAEISTIGADWGRAWFVADKDMKIISVAPKNTDYSAPQKYIIPISDDNAAWLCVNFRNTNYTSTDHIWINLYSGTTALMQAILQAGSGSNASASSTDALLHGLSFLDFGDSVAYGANANGTGYADLLAALLGGTVKEYAVSGYKLSQILGQVDKAINAGNKADVVLMEGGLNDMCGATEETGAGGSTAYTVADMEKYGIHLGDFKPYDYSTPTATTFTGLVEQIMYKVKTNFSDAIPIWVIPHRTSYRDAELQDICAMRIKACAQKWGVVVVDIFHDSSLNAQLKTICKGYTDWDSGKGGTHPLLAGYKKYYVPTIMHALRCYAVNYY